MNLWTVVLAILVVPSLALGASLHQFKVAEPVKADNAVVVPLVITNQDNLAGMDIPLRFSEGVTLKEVQFEGTRVDYFDLKVANINNQDRTVVIGLLPQMTPVEKPELAAGTGVIANLVFEVNDASVSQIEVEAVTTENPNHTLTFVYTDESHNIRVERPDFDNVSLSLSGVNGPTLPQEFYLSQNYPNPFNPSTTFEFALPTPSHVELTVYNVLGQTVSTVVNDNLSAGIHTFSWDASNVSSGVYFYRLTTDQNQETKKMMLLK
jgi:hypothetical protein